MAPEMLRTPKQLRPENGTKAADVYAFAIILQEAILLSQPYSVELAANLTVSGQYGSVYVRVKITRGLEGKTSGEVYLFT